MKITGQLYAVAAKQRAYRFCGTEFPSGPEVYTFVGDYSECQIECDRLVAEQNGLRQRADSGTLDAGVARVLAIRYRVVPVRVVPM